MVLKSPWVPFQIRPHEWPQNCLRNMRVLSLSHPAFLTCCSCPQRGLLAKPQWRMDSMDFFHQSISAFCCHLFLSFTSLYAHVFPVLYKNCRMNFNQSGILIPSNEGFREICSLGQGSSDPVLTWKYMNTYTHGKTKHKLLNSPYTRDSLYYLGGGIFVIISVYSTHINEQTRWPQADICTKLH